MSFQLVTALIAYTLTVVAISTYLHRLREWPIQWERLLATLLEVAFGLYLIERVDGWITLLAKEVAK